MAAMCAGLALTWGGDGRSEMIEKGALSPPAHADTLQHPSTHVNIIDAHVQIGGHGRVDMVSLRCFSRVLSLFLNHAMSFTPLKTHNRTHTYTHTERGRQRRQK